MKAVNIILTISLFIQWNSFLKLNFYKKSYLHGNEVRFFVNDTIKNGIFKKTSKSGLLLEYYIYSNGLKNGESKTYYDNGSIHSDCIFKNGQLDGVCKWYDLSGNISKQISYSEGFFNGTWISYIKGKKIIEANFKSGKIDGCYFDYYKNGIIQHKACYSNGTLITSEDFYNKNSTLKYKLISNHADKIRNHLVIKINYDKLGNVTRREPVDSLPIAYAIFDSNVF